MYAIRTDTMTFFLDAAGICRGVTTASRDAAALDRARRVGARCIGAQYVASIDVSVPGALVELPREGGTLVFAVVDAAGRVSLVRTPRVVSVERVKGASVRDLPDLLDDVAADAEDTRAGRTVVMDASRTTVMDVPPSALAPAPAGTQRMLPASPDSSLSISVDLDV